MLFKLNKSKSALTVYPTQTSYAWLPNTVNSTTIMPIEIFTHPLWSIPNAISFIKLSLILGLESLSFLKLNYFLCLSNDC